MSTDATKEALVGYKHSGIGVIPDDWGVDTLASVTPHRAQNQHGIVDGPFGSNLKRIHYRHSGVPIITSGYVTGGIFKAEEYLYVDAEKFKQERRSAVSAGDIVMAKIGARCGACAILPAGHPTGILSGNTLKITVDESRHSTYFIWQLLWNRYASGGIEAWKSVGAQPAISMPVLKKQLFQLPPLPEQAAIAEALSDVDGLLGALEALIAKKRAIKQAVMQQLLTGKTRLPGFSGEWETRRLGEDVALLSGHHVMARYCNTRGDGTPYLTGPADFPEGRIQQTKFTVRPTTLCRPGDILVTVKGSGSGTLVEADGEYCISRQLMAIRTTYWNAKFLFFSLVQNASRIATGSTGLIPGLSRADILEQGLPFPSGAAEQAAIATVLSDMDAEIAAIERRHDKTRAIKQGMMQQLLTGRVRLVAPALAEASA